MAPLAQLPFCTLSSMSWVGSTRRRSSQADQELHTKTITRATAVQGIHIGRYLAAQYLWPWPVLLRCKDP